SVIPGGPADKAQIHNGDIIEAIDGKSTREMSLAEVHNLVTGEPGSNVNLSLVRARRAEPQKVTVTRAVVSVPASSEKMMEANVGYIKVFAFNKGKAQEIASRIRSLEHAGAKKLILDLRNVSSGEPQEGISTANLFLSRGAIASLSGQKYKREDFSADAQKAVTSLPLVVLVNRGRRRRRIRRMRPMSSCGGRLKC